MIQMKMTRFSFLPNGAQGAQDYWETSYRQHPHLCPKSSDWPDCVLLPSSSALRELSPRIHRYAAAAAAAKSLQLCPTLCDPIDGRPPGFPIPGILQARTLEWVAISFSKAWKWKGKVKSLSRVQLFETPWTAAHQTPPSKGFSRQRVLEWSAIAFSKMSA